MIKIQQLFIFGYAYTNNLPRLISSNLIGDNTLTCGNNVVNVPINTFEYGQFNFVFKIECNENITWSVNGSVLILSKEDLDNKLCSDVGTQKLVLTNSQQSTFSSPDIDSMKNNLASIYSINASRVNITQRPNDEYENINGELIFSISSNSYDPTEEQHSSIIYNFTQSFQNEDPKLKQLFANTTLNKNDFAINTLTFNETVGKKSGCFMKDDSGNLLSLLLGNVDNCTPNSSLIDDNSSQSMTLAPIIIGVVIGIFASILLTIAILMIIPGTRNAIFPRLKIRESIKKKIEE